MHQWLSRGIPGTTRLGRRTLILLHCGTVWLITGWAIQAVPVERFSQPGPDDALQILDSPAWSLMWIVGGTLAILNALLRKPWNGRDVLGFLGLTTPPFVWLLAYLWSAIVYVTTGTDGNPRAWLGVLTWYLVSAFVLIVAGWPDPDDPDIDHRRGANEG